MRVHPLHHDAGAYPLTLYYESACPLCNGEMRNLMLRNRDGLLRFVDVSAPGFVPPAGGPTLADMLTLMRGQRADGTWLTGVAVFRLAYVAAGLPRVSQLLNQPLLGRLAERTYPWIARHRRALPHWISHALFETTLRRAAERAASDTSRCHAGHCDIHTHTER